MNNRICGSKDPFSPRVCDRNCGHEGLHEDSQIGIVTDCQWCAKGDIPTKLNGHWFHTVSMDGESVEICTTVQGGPHALIEWKGTDVCMDCYCACGKQFHIDAEFAYAVKCKHCGRIYEMSSMVGMREIKDGEVWNGCDPREDRD